MEKDRLIIFIDHANIYKNIKLIGVLIDYIRFRDVLSEGYHLVGTLIFVGLLEKITKEKGKFYEFLELNGFHIVYNPVKRIYTGGYRQKGTDLAIFKNATELANIDSYDKGILVSGDGDFVGLVNTLKESNKRIEIWSFKKSLAKELKDAVGARNVHYIDDILDEIEFKSGN